MPISTIPTSGLSSDQGVNFRNLIINGDMSIAQRSTSVTGIGASDGYFTVDRFQYTREGSPSARFTQSQSTVVPSGQGFASSIKMDCTTAQGSLSSGDGFNIQHKIEGQNLQLLKYGSSSAETLTLSFWVRATKTGTNIVWIYQNDDSRSQAQAYTISSADTWEKKTLTVVADTTGVIDNNNGEGFRISWWLGAGTNFTSGSLATTWQSHSSAITAVGQVNHADNTANDFYLTGVQLEVGTSASDFEFLPFDVNLDRCMRYYFEEGGDDPKGFVAIAFGASDSPFRYEFKKPMRAAPTGSYSGVIDSDIALYHNGGWRTLTAMSFTAITVNGARVEINSSGAFTTGKGGHVYLLNGAGKFKFDAEL